MGFLCFVVLELMKFGICVNFMWLVVDMDMIQVVFDWVGVVVEKDGKLRLKLVDFGFGVFEEVV